MSSSLYKKLLMDIKLTNDKIEVLTHNKYNILELPLEESFKLKVASDYFVHRETDGLVSDMVDSKISYYCRNTCIKEIKFDITISQCLLINRTAFEPEVYATIKTYANAGGGFTLINKETKQVVHILAPEIFHKFTFNTVTDEDRKFLFDKITQYYRDAFTCKNFSYGEIEFESGACDVQ